MTLQLAEILDLKAAGPLRGALLEARGAPIEIDASGVQRFGGLCLQVLLSAQATWATDGQPFMISAASSAFADGARRMGAQDLAPDPIIQE
ncbi:MAG TPA: STAS domain-containing protein [Caulobacteraceae bacterium]|jgi:chemotaxis protein CheX|nr:STAS domain-containing protein [Caulobacteraceae bacterium]